MPHRQYVSSISIFAPYPFLHTFPVALKSSCPHLAHPFLISIYFLYIVQFVLVLNVAEIKQQSILYVQV